MILKAVDRIRDMPYNKIMRESVTNGLTYIAELLGGLALSNRKAHRPGIKCPGAAAAVLKGAVDVKTMASAWCLLQW